MEIITTVLVGIVLGFAKAISNVLMSEQKWKQSIFKNNHGFFSWLGETSKRRSVNGKETFFGSKTFLVAFTDAWHLFDIILIFGLFIAGNVFKTNDEIVLIVISFFSSFNIFYHYILTKSGIEIRSWVFTVLFLLIGGALGMQYIDESLRFLLGTGLLIMGLVLCYLLFKFVFLMFKILTIK